ncbi:uncharacterized protein [Diabrotica undecimpunctata]|uniref:uncharacterized protein n=1 Tax=Diabrotica undecimpunctata TaxID=50387 RepID=UPI003B6427E9
MPSIQINPTQLEIPKNIMLADPEFCKPAKVDTLLGVKLFYKLLSVGQISLKNQPNAVLQKTQLGWIVAGEIKNSSRLHHISCHNSPMSDFNLNRFWEMKDIPSIKILSPEEKACEEHYQCHTTRDVNGRYIVRLPFNDKKSKLGDSYNSALKRFYSLENRFSKDPVLQMDYSAFLQSAGLSMRNYHTFLIRMM